MDDFRAKIFESFKGSIEGSKHAGLEALSPSDFVNHTDFLASGKTDIITDGKRCYCIKNGTSQLARVTGTGDMLGVLCGCYLSAKKDIWAVVSACAVLGICGELAETSVGNGSFMVNLMDRLSTLKREDINKWIKWEEKSIENL